LIDFGSSFEIWDKNGKHKPFVAIKKFTGNLMFASANICRGATLSRRDDIESLIYIYVYLLNNHELPWSKWQKALAENTISMKQIRSRRSKPEMIDEVYKMLPSKTIKSYYMRVTELFYEDEPDYDAL
jgi:casein kinase I family protein HRR25